VQRRFAPLGEGEQMWSRLLAGQEARYIREHEEEAAIEAEDFWGKHRRGLRCGSYGLMDEEQETRRYRWEDRAGKEVAK
jgi:hypothetical protein